MEEETGKYSKILEIIYIIILAVSAMGDMPSFSDSVSRMMKAISLVIVAIGAAVILISGNFSRVKKTASFIGVYGFILIAIIVWSMFLWIVNLESVFFIVRGVTKFMYQFLLLLIIFAGVYMFGERAAYATFYGLVAANIAMVLINVRIYGISDSVSSIIAMFKGADAQTGFAKAMEIHDITFSFGFFVLYFMFFAKHDKERIVDLILAVFFFVLGWKRIALAALPVSIVVAVILGRMKPRARKRFMMTLAWVFVILSFLYVVATKTGLFERVMNELNIDTMGRNEVYGFIEKYYDINIGFLGYGFEYTTVILQQIQQTNPELKIGVLALHNNILTVYIELGFVGFWAWIVYTWVFQLRWMYSHWGEKVAMLFFLCELYIFITYTTDNTLYYYYTSFVLRLLPAAYAFHVPDEKEIKTWPWVKEQTPGRIARMFHVNT